jgi:hypothetical protein
LLTAKQNLHTPDHSTLKQKQSKPKAEHEALIYKLRMPMVASSGRTPVCCVQQQKRCIHLLIFAGTQRFPILLPAIQSLQIARQRQFCFVNSGAVF